jgi:hypothetical protein
MRPPTQAPGRFQFSPDVGGDTLHTADAVNRPTLTDNNDDVVNLDDGTTVKGVAIDPQGTGGGIAGSSGDTGGGTIDDVIVLDAGTSGTQPGVELDGTTGTFNVSNLTVTTNGSIGVRLNNAGTVAFAPTGTISVSTSGAKALDATGTAMATSAFDTIAATGSTTGGVSMTSTTGTTTFGDLTLTTTGGSSPAFLLNSAGTISVPASGTANLSAAGGPAVDVTGTSGATLAFDGVSSTNSATDGVNIAGLGAGTFSAATGSIQNAGGVDFDLDGGSGTVTYPGAITDDAGQLVRVQNTAGGTKSFSGAITDGNDGDGGGIALANNPGATIRFDGGLTLSTGTSAALSATGGGTLAVPDPAGSAVNSIVTTTGTALNVVNTTIHGDGLAFQSIASNGAPNGIVLNNTGANGGLTVTGTGSAGSGGTIQNTTSDSIALTSTRSVNLSWMNVTSSRESGILGSSVVGLTLNNDSFVNNGDDAGDDGIRIADLTGTNAWTALNVTGSARNNVFIDNTTGTMSSLAVSGASHFDNLGASFGANAFLVQARGTAVITSGSIDGATFADNKPARGITVQAQDGGRIGDSSSNAFVVENSTFVNNGLHASFEQSGTAQLTFRLLDNGSAGAPMTMPNAVFGTSHAVNVFSSSTSTGGTIRGRISGNYIGDPAVVGSGSATGNGIRAMIQGKTVATLLIDSNTVRQTPQARGVDLQFLGPLDSSGVASPHDVTVINNSVIPSDSTGFPASAIYVAADSQGGGAVTLRADIRGNTVPAGTAVDSLPTFLALDKVAVQAVCQLVNTTGSADATAQLTATNTGSASAASGCTLIAGPITTPP